MRFHAATIPHVFAGAVFFAVATLALARLRLFYGLPSGATHTNPPPDSGALTGLTGRMDKAEAIPYLGLVREKHGTIGPTLTL